LRGHGYSKAVAPLTLGLSHPICRPNSRAIKVQHVLLVALLPARFVSIRLSLECWKERMSHHFDTPTAREDPRIDVCDFYLFRGRPGFTVMAMTVNPDAGRSAPDTFRDEGLYD
jgi:hypothetical protein